MSVFALFLVWMWENADQKNSEYRQFSRNDSFSCSSFQNVDQNTDVYDYLKLVNPNTNVIFWCCLTQTKMTFQTFMLKCHQDSSMLLWPTITNQAWWVLVARKSKVVPISTRYKMSLFGVILVRIFPHFSVFSPNAGKYGPE